MVFCSEPDFILKLKQGDSRTVTAWYESSKVELLAFFTRKVDNPADASELMHDTYLSCLSSLPLFRGHSGLWSWMLSIARHELADYWRKKYAKRLIAVLPYGSELLDSVEIGSASEEELGIKNQESSQIKALLQKLPSEISELLQLKYVDGLSIKELAGQYGVSFSAMQSKLYRAKELFVKEYERIQSL